jgi:hypothetical protein
MSKDIKKQLDLLKAKIIDMRSRKVLADLPSDKKTEVPKSRDAAVSQTAAEGPSKETIRSARFGTPEGSIWLSMHHDGTKSSHGVGRTRDESRKNTIEGMVPGKTGHPDFIPEIGKQAVQHKQGRLVVGANNYLRNKLPFFLLQQYDHHIIHHQDEQGTHHVGVIALHRQHADRAPIVTHASGETGEKALTGALHQQLIEARPVDHDEDHNPISGQKSDDPHQAKKNTWLTHWIYRQPKKSLKDLLTSEEPKMAKSMELEPGQSILEKAKIIDMKSRKVLADYAPRGEGSGFGTHQPGRHVTDINEIKENRVYAVHSDQFKARNLLRVTSHQGDKIKGIFVDPTNLNRPRQGGDHIHNYWDFDIAEGGSNRFHEIEHDKLKPLSGIQNDPLHPKRLKKSLSPQPGQSILEKAKIIQGPGTKEPGKVVAKLPTQETPKTAYHAPGENGAPSKIVAPNLKDGHDEGYSHYVQAALWSTNDESDESGGKPMDANHSEEHLSRPTRAKMKADWMAFSSEHSDMVAKYGHEQVAHDFWLTRNGHGAGFWDGGYEEADGKKLTASAKKFGEHNLYVGDDKKIYSNRDHEAPKPSGKLLADNPKTKPESKRLARYSAAALAHTGQHEDAMNMHLDAMRAEYERTGGEDNDTTRYHLQFAERHKEAIDKCPGCDLKDASKNDLKKASARDLRPGLSIEDLKHMPVIEVEKKRLDQRDENTQAMHYHLAQAARHTLHRDELERQKQFTAAPDRKDTIATAIQNHHNAMKAHQRKARQYYDSGLVVGTEYGFDLHMADHLAGQSKTTRTAPPARFIPHQSERKSKPE